MESGWRLHHVLYGNGCSHESNVPPEEYKCTTGGQCTPDLESLLEIGRERKINREGEKDKQRKKEKERVREKEKERKRKRKREERKRKREKEKERERKKERRWKGFKR